MFWFSLVIFSVVTCDPPDTVGNGTFTPFLSIFNYSSIVTYTCDHGYYISNGNSSRYCTESGTWSGTKPTCSSKYKYTNLVETLPILNIKFCNIKCTTI